MPNNIDEAMALAAANPVVGMSGPHHASFIVNVMNHDKDLGDDGRVLTGLSKSLDMDDNLYGVDQNGRFFAKRKYDVMERKDIIECYKVNVDCTKLMESIEAELKIPYESRPVHKQSYIYEALTGKALLSEDQMEYDSLCEKVQLDKMTAALAGVTQGSLERAHNMQSKGNKDAGYIPDNDYPQGTENMSVPGMALESTKPKFTTRLSNKGNTSKLSMHYSSPNEDWKKKHQVKDTKNGHEEITVEKWEQNGQDLKNLREVANTKFYVEGETMYSMNENMVGDLFYKGIRTVNDFTFKHQPYNVYCITSANAYPNRPFCSSLKQATFDYLRTIHPKYKNINTVKVDEIRISKKWFESNKNKNVILWTAVCTEKKSEDKIYLPNEYQKMASLTLENLFRSYSLDLVLESTLEDGMMSLLGIKK